MSFQHVRETAEFDSPLTGHLTGDEAFFAGIVFLVFTLLANIFGDEPDSSRN